MAKKNTENPKKQKKRITGKQAAALGGVIVLLLLYLVTLAAAILDSSSSGTLFRLCLVATVAVPMLLWIYIWMYGKLTGRHTVADYDRGDGSRQGEDPSASDSHDS